MIFRYLQSLKITKLYKTEWCLNQKNGRIDTKLYNFTLLFQRYCYNLLFNCFTHLGRWTTLKLYLNRWGTVLARLADAPLNLLPVWNSLKLPPPPLLLSLFLPPSTTKIITGPLAVIIQDYFKNHLELRIAKTAIHSATSQSGAKGGLHASSWLAISKTRKKLSYYLFRVCCSSFSQGRKSLYNSLHLNINMYFFSLVGDQFLNSHDPNVWFWLDRVRRIWCKPLQVFLGLTP